MLRNFSVCIFALVAVLLFSSDASACRSGPSRSHSQLSARRISNPSR